MAVAVAVGRCRQASRRRCKCIGLKVATTGRFYQPHTTRSTEYHMVPYRLPDHVGCVCLCVPIYHIQPNPIQHNITTGINYPPTHPPIHRGSHRFNLHASPLSLTPRQKASGLLMSSARLATSAGSAGSAGSKRGQRMALSRPTYYYHYQPTQLAIGTEYGALNPSTTRGEEKRGGYHIVPASILLPDRN